MWREKQIAFPLSLRGELLVANAPGPESLNTITKAVLSKLEENRPDSIHRDGTTLRFEFGAFARSDRHSFLTQFSSGVIRVEDHTNACIVIYYDLKLAGRLAVTIALSVFMGVFATLFAGLFVGGFVSLVSWTWIFGGTYFLSAVFVPRDLRRVVRDLSLDTPDGAPDT